MVRCGVGQQHHVAHAEIEQDLRADAVVAQLGAAGRLRARAWPRTRSERLVGTRLADQHDDAAALVARSSRMAPLQQLAAALVSLAEHVVEHVRRACMRTSTGSGVRRCRP